jgi:hypothetical protein
MACTADGMACANNAQCCNNSCVGGVCKPPVVGVGNCCTAHTPGTCTVKTISDCLCAIDTYCCDTAWDAQCVTEAVSNNCAVCP